MNPFASGQCVCTDCCVLCSFLIQALDCFTAMLSRSESRLQMAEAIGSKLNISKEQVPKAHNDVPITTYNQQALEEL